jgi:hypothetical protein
MSDELPPEVLKVLSKLWRDPRPLHMVIHPRDAWVTVAVIQFATRNPQLSETQRESAIAVARVLQEAIGSIAPEAAGYLEDGWNPALDVAR